MPILEFLSAGLTFGRVLRGRLTQMLADDARQAAYTQSAGATYEWCELFRTADPAVLERVYKFLDSEACARQVAGVLSDSGPARFDFESLRSVYASEGLEHAPSCVDLLRTLTHELSKALRVVFKTDLNLQFDFSRLDEQITAAFIIEENKRNLADAVVDIGAMVRSSVGQTATIDASQQAVIELQGELLKHFHARVEQVVTSMKESKSYASSEPVFKSLLDEALQNPSLRESAELLRKLYTNLTVCAERMGDMEATVLYAQKGSRREANGCEGFN